MTRKVTGICENVGNATIKSRKKMWSGMALKTATIKATNVSLSMAKIQVIRKKMHQGVRQKARK